MKLKPLRYEDDSEKHKKYVLIGSIIAALITVFLIMELRNPVIQTDRYAAYSAALEFVGKTLENPGTADFQSVNSAEIKELEDNIWEINSYVDKKDASGTTRTFFTIQVQYDGSEWSLKHLNLKEKN